MRPCERIQFNRLEFSHKNVRVVISVLGLFCGFSSIRFPRRFAYRLRAIYETTEAIRFWSHVRSKCKYWLTNEKTAYRRVCILATSRFIEDNAECGSLRFAHCKFLSRILELSQCYSFEHFHVSPERKSI